MASRSLNKVILIGNLTRDPELRYTPQGTAVCTFGVATNRSWVTDGGEKREDTEFHRIVAWNKLAELCSQLLFKGRKVYIEGRLQTRSWVSQDGSQRQVTEIISEEMIILDNRQAEEVKETPQDKVTVTTETVKTEETVVLPEPSPTKKTVKSETVEETVEEKPVVEEKSTISSNVADDIPF